MRVSFTDDAGNDESLTSAPTDAVSASSEHQEEEEVIPLAAVIENAPSSRDGETAFTFKLRFSEEVRVSYGTLRDRAFKVTGRSVLKAKQMEQGSNLRWRITVRPGSDGA